MTFLLLIVALLIEVFWEPVSQYRSFKPCFIYTDKWLDLFDKDLQWPGLARVALVVVPLVLVVSVLTGLDGGVFELLISAIISTLALLWSLGPLTTHQFSQSLKQKHEEGNLAEQMLCYVHNGYLAVAFWFVVLGPVGAVVYRFMREFAEREAQQAAQQEEQDKGIWCSVFHWIDWLPVRVSSALFLMTGDFMRGFEGFRKQSFDFDSNNHAYLCNIGMPSLALGDEQEPLAAAKQLAERSLILMVVIIALIALIG